MKKKIKKKLDNCRIHKKLEKVFEPGTYESFLLHDFLFLTNFGLTILMFIEWYLLFVHDFDWHGFHEIDFFFGILFLIESILRILYKHLPNKERIEPHMVVNWVVIISLVWPGLFFNLAFLRIIRSLKVIKTYLYRKEKKEEEKPKYDGILKIIWIANKTVFDFVLRKLRLKK